MKNLIVIFSFMICIFSISCSQKQQNINRGAAIQTMGDLPENPLLLIPLTSSIQPQNHTMSTLYGNEISAKHAQEFHDSNYPKGAVLYEVTWKQKADSVWFGGNIPEKIETVERLSYLDNNEPTFEIFTGDSFKKGNVSLTEVQWRTKLISAKKIAVSP